MKRRLISITTILAVVMALALPIVAQKISDTKFEKVYLKLEGVSSSDFRSVKITNTTKQIIPKGKKIYWFYNGAKDVIELTHDMKLDDVINDSAEAKNINHPNEAYYLKLAGS